jgi:hypothetical protein
VVHFKDGSKWVADSLPSGSYNEREQVALLLSTLSRVPIREIPIFQTGDVTDFFWNKSAPYKANPSSKIWPDAIYAMCKHAEREAATGHLKEAERDYKTAVSWTPGDDSYLVQLGQFYALWSHEWDKAWDIADGLIRSNPDNPDGWVLRAEIQQGQPRPGLHETNEYIVQHFSNSKDDSVKNNVASAKYYLDKEGQQR